MIESEIQPTLANRNPGAASAPVGSGSAPRIDDGARMIEELAAPGSTAVSAHGRLDRDNPDQPVLVDVKNCGAYGTGVQIACRSSGRCLPELRRARGASAGPERRPSPTSQSARRLLAAWRLAGIQAAATTLPAGCKSVVPACRQPAFGRSSRRGSRNGSCWLAGRTVIGGDGRAASGHNGEPGSCCADDEVTQPVRHGFEPSPIVALRRVGLANVTPWHISMIGHRHRHRHRGPAICLPGATILRPWSPG